MITDVNKKKEYCYLYLDFSIAAAQMDTNDKNISVVAMDVEPVSATDPEFWKWADQ